MEEIKRLLLEEKASLLLVMQEKTAKNNKIISDIGDAIDSSVEEQERELDLLLQDREQARLLGIEEALKRMELDDFGYCDECGENISKAAPLLQRTKGQYVTKDLPSFDLPGVNAPLDNNKTHAYRER